MPISVSSPRTCEVPGTLAGPGTVGTAAALLAALARLGRGFRGGGGRQVAEVEAVGLGHEPARPLGELPAQADRLGDDLLLAGEGRLQRGVLARGAAAVGALALRPARVDRVAREGAVA